MTRDCSSRGYSREAREPDGGVPLPSGVTIVGGDSLADLSALEILAEAVFGAGERRPGWFARKLWREGVDPQLCAVALRGDLPCGYALLGRAPALGSTARGAGVGVLPELRGRGLGARLLDAACARARAADIESVEFLAEAERLPWYLRQGFSPAREEWALLAQATGPVAQALPASKSASSALTGAAKLGPAPLWSWVPQCWARTPPSERGVVDLHPRGVPLRAWFSLEGEAILIHRLELERERQLSGLGAEPADVAPSLDALRRCWPAPQPILLYPCPVDAPWALALTAGPWLAAQRSTVVRRSSQLP